MIDTTEQVLVNLKQQLQGLYADKSIVEDKIFELRSVVQGFTLAVEVQSNTEAGTEALAKEDLRRSKAAARAQLNCPAVERE